MSRRPTPFDELARVLEQLGRELEARLEGLDWNTNERGGFGWGPDGRPGFSIAGDEPPLDLADDGDRFVVTLDVPGYEASTLSVRLLEDTLLVSGRRNRPPSNNRRRETFKRRVLLPERVDTETAQATLNNGVLSIILEKLEPSDRPTQIDVT